MLLIDEDVAAGQRRLVEMPDQRLLLERQRRKAVRIQLDDGGVVDAIEQVFAICGWRRVPGAGCRRVRAGGVPVTNSRRAPAAGRGARATDSSYC